MSQERRERKVAKRKVTVSFSCPFAVWAGVEEYAEQQQMNTSHAVTEILTWFLKAQGLLDAGEARMGAGIAAE